MMLGLRQSVRDLWRSLSAGALPAHERGIEFLTQNLSPTQRQQYERHGYFDVIGGDTGKRYRIWHGSQLNVEQLDQNGRRVRLCFMPKGGVPVGDIMLAQKIALEVFESEAIKVATGPLAWDHFFENELRVRRHLRR
jgi:hypothetical protein